MSYLFHCCSKSKLKNVFTSLVRLSSGLTGQLVLPHRPADGQGKLFTDWPGLCFSPWDNTGTSVLIRSLQKNTPDFSVSVNILCTYTAIPYCNYKQHAVSCIGRVKSLENKAYSWVMICPVNGEASSEVTLKGEGNSYLSASVPCRIYCSEYRVYLQKTGQGASM